MVPEHTPADASILLPLPRLRRPPEAPAVARTGVLSLDQVSSLLWNGLGFSRHVHGRAALPRSWRPGLQVYALLAEGAYRYDLEEHRLDLVTPSDLRTLLNGPGSRTAALQLLYVTAQACHADDAWEECGRLALEDVDRVAQHVAAWCSAQGLVAAATRNVAARARSALRLAPGEHVALAQRIDWPAQAAC